MKVQKINQSFADSAAKVTREESIAEVQSSMPFERHLTQLSQSNYEQYVNGLLQNIAEQGERMAKRADLKELHKYREMIRQFMQEAVSNGFSFSKTRKFDSRGRNKSFALIQRINEKLDEMTQALLSEEADHIELMKNVDEIRGMLVDLLM